jgi:hypothetical protein
MFKKTRITSPMKSQLIEISLLKGCILITAFVTGEVNITFNHIFSKKKSQEILREIDEDYEKLWNNVIVYPESKTIRIQ